MEAEKEPSDLKKVTGASNEFILKYVQHGIHFI